MDIACHPSPGYSMSSSAASSSARANAFSIASLMSETMAVDASTLAGLGYNPLNPLTPMDVYPPHPSAHQQRSTDCYGWGQTGSSTGYGIKGMEGKQNIYITFPSQWYFWFHKRNAWFWPKALSWIHNYMYFGAYEGTTAQEIFTTILPHCIVVVGYSAQ